MSSTDRNDWGPFALPSGGGKTSALTAAGAMVRRSTDRGPVRVTVLGATGSIGQSTLDLIRYHPDRYCVAALTAQSNVAALATAAKAVRAGMAVIGDARLGRELAERLAGTGIQTAAGRRALVEAAQVPADVTVAAIVGAAGLEPTLAAVAQGRRIALANKECLVAAGAPFMAAVRRFGTEVIPVDSEHAGVFQCLIGADLAGVEKITITASGGPFRTWTADAIAAARPEHALKHPNWVMGRKITIDSATLMNKGLELIEAHHLFACPPDRLGCVVHPQSLVHAFVHYADGSVMAQMGAPDMRTAIGLSLAWPERQVTPVARLDLETMGSLSFEPADRVRFPCLRLAEAAMARGGLATAVLNAANEMAVEAFLDGRLRFLGIAQTVEAALDVAERQGHLDGDGSLEAVLAADATGRRLAIREIETLAPQC